MKKNLFVKIAAILTALFIFIAAQAAAAPDPELVQKSAESLVKLGILKGNPDGSLNLEAPVKRSEFITMVIRTMAFDIQTDTTDVVLSFDDVKETYWAYDNFKIALKQKLITGYPDNTLCPENPVTYPEACVIIMRAFGYTEALPGKWPSNVVARATELEINKNLIEDANIERRITRGEASILIYNSLITAFYDPESFGF
jgi:hypothetical protein